MKNYIFNQSLEIKHLNFKDIFLFLFYYQSILMSEYIFKFINK